MIDALVRPNVKKLKPYTSARHLHQEGLLLDANENPFGSVVKVPFQLELNRYPDPFCKGLKNGLSKYLQTAPENLFIGVGSDEIIDLLIRLFVGPDEEVIVCEPTYGMYQVAADIAGIASRRCLLTSDFQLDLNAIGPQAGSKTRLLFCCSPNNPTGNVLNPEDIEKLCKNFQGIVVVDEAYVEFSSKPSLLRALKLPENLVLLRTFSKAWGLAGARIGYAIMNPKIVEYLNKIKPPYNMNSVSALLAQQALENEKQFLEWRKVILAEREKLSNGFGALGFKVFPSEANFILVRRAGGARLVKRLAEEFKIIVRDVSGKSGLADCVRVSVGTPEENARLLKAAGELV